MTVTSPAGHVTWKHLGRIAWRDARDLQESLWQAHVDGNGQDTLLTLEHDPVITLGRRAKRTDLLLTDEELTRRGIDVVEADRGGELTWHGPGQLVVYAVIALQPHRLGASDLVRGLAQGANTWLASMGVQAEYDPDRPGLWVNGAKIAAVGMRIRKGISLHGLALNLEPELNVFQWFVPCGLPNARVTCLRDEALGPHPTLETAAEAVAYSVAAHFGWTLRPA